MAFGIVIFLNALQEFNYTLFLFKSYWSSQCETHTILQSIRFKTSLWRYVSIHLLHGHFFIYIHSNSTEQAHFNRQRRNKARSKVVTLLNWQQFLRDKLPLFISNHCICHADVHQWNMLLNRFFLTLRQQKSWFWKLFKTIQKIRYWLFVVACFFPSFHWMYFYPNFKNAICFRNSHLFVELQKKSDRLKILNERICSNLSPVVIHFLFNFLYMNTSFLQKKWTSSSWKSIFHQWNRITFSLYWISSSDWILFVLKNLISYSI